MREEEKMKRKGMEQTSRENGWKRKGKKKTREERRGGNRRGGVSMKKKEKESVERERDILSSL